MHSFPDGDGGGGGIQILREEEKEGPLLLLLPVTCIYSHASEPETIIIRVSNRHRGQEGKWRLE